MEHDFDLARRHFLEGVAHFEAQRLDAAEHSFGASLQHWPGRASARINLAATRLLLGRPAEALAELESVLEAEPQHADAWCHRAAALDALARPEEALHCADRALALDPDSGSAWFRRGQALERLRRFGEALTAIERAAALQPDDAGTRHRLGLLQHRQGRLAEALSSQERVLALAPAHAAAWSERGALLQALGRSAEAAAAFQRAIDSGADADLHRFFIAALGRAPGPAQAPQAYVRALFDDYADSFDRHLVDELGYEAHHRLVAPLAGLQPQAFASALDLGCGTGLCGPLLRPIVQWLQGVDLSQPMLDRAAARGVYDELVCADLTTHLQQTDRRHDLVVAADVFIYVGDLDAVFAGVQRVLQPGGVFCFTVEPAPDAHAVQLHAQMRYAHSLPYLQALAQRHGLRVLRTDTQPLRRQRTQQLPGLYLYLGR